MNRLRSLLFTAIVVISSSTLALGGDMQGPGKSEPPPPPPESVLSTQETEIAWRDLTTKMVLEILLTIFESSGRSVIALGGAGAVR
jgi:hypothetical protein